MERVAGETTSNVRETIAPRIRWMVARDLLDVMSIERRSFEFPWTERDFDHVLSRRNCIGMVAELWNGIGGFMIYELERKRIHVLNFAVAQAARRQGVGSQLVAKLVNKLSQQRQRIHLEVRERNLPAQLLFRAMRFRAVAVLHGFYEETLEDAYVFERRALKVIPHA